MDTILRTTTIYKEIIEYIVDYLENEIEFYDLANSYYDLTAVLMNKYQGVNGEYYTATQQFILEEIDVLLSRRLYTIEEPELADNFPLITEEELRNELLLLMQQIKTNQLFS